jgi:hypothetical protein
MPGGQELSGATLDDQLQRVARQLGEKYSDRAENDEVADAVYEEADRYRDAKITQFIPVLVQHAVQERFRLRRPRDPALASH